MKKAKVILGTVGFVFAFFLMESVKKKDREKAEIERSLKEQYIRLKTRVCVEKEKTDADWTEEKAAVWLEAIREFAIFTRSHPDFIFGMSKQYEKTFVIGECR